MKLRKNDKVVIITGKEKGKTGKVLLVFKSINKILVEGVNKVKRHVKPGKASKEGGIISVERPIPVSNVMFYDDKLGKPSRIGYKLAGEKKVRFNKKSGDVIDAK